MGNYTFLFADVNLYYFVSLFVREALNLANTIHVGTFTAVFLLISFHTPLSALAAVGYLSSLTESVLLLIEVSQKDVKRNNTSMKRRCSSSCKKLITSVTKQFEPSSQFVLKG